MKRTFAIAGLEIKSFIRDFKQRAIMFVLPIIFMGVFAFAFGGSSDEATIKLVVLQNGGSAQEQITSQLASLRTQGDHEQYEITPVADEASARKQIQDQDADAALLVQSVGSAKVPDLRLLGTPSNLRFQVANAQIAAVVGGLYGLPTSPVRSESIAADVSSSPFQLLAPGLLVYGILILIPNVASAIATIRESKQHLRYYMSHTRAYEIIAGNVLALLVLALIQTSILLGCAWLFGFDPVGNLALGYVVAVPTAIFTVAVAVLIGSFIRNRDAASNTGIMISIILGFLSGCFLTLPPLMAGGVDVLRLLPTRHATIAMTNLLLYGQDVSESVGSLAVIAGTALVLLVIAAVVFARRQFRNVAEY